jgi:hypothetical protein
MNKKGIVQKNINNVTENSNENRQDWLLEDEMLRKEFVNEISLANSLINKLEYYYSKNNKYPDPVGFIYDDLEKEITNASGKTFYYTWLDWHYVLTFELPDGTGLIYFSETKLWGIGKYLP